MASPLHRGVIVIGPHLPPTRRRQPTRLSNWLTISRRPTNGLPAIAKDRVLPVNTERSKGVAERLSTSSARRSQLSDISIFDMVLHFEPLLGRSCPASLPLDSRRLQLINFQRSHRLLLPGRPTRAAPAAVFTYRHTRSSGSTQLDRPRRHQRRSWHRRLRSAVITHRASRPPLPTDTAQRSRQLLIASYHREKEPILPTLAANH